MDYNRLLDAQTWAFIRKTAESYPEDVAGLSIVQQRRAYDTMCRSFYQGRPDGIMSDDRSGDGVPVRVYSAGSPTRSVVYFHGGGFIYGGLESHDDVCAEICHQTAYRVISVDYRLSPEHKHPAAFDDAWAATRWVAGEYGNDLILAGDSAGANLAAATTHFARGKPVHILGQVLIYPSLGNGLATASQADHAQAPLLTSDDCAYYQASRLAGGVPRDDPTFAPLEDSDFSNLPPTVIFTADCDPLRDDGPAYRDHLLDAGGAAHWVNEAGLVHGYLRARTSVDRARASFERITVAIEALGQGMWPYE